MYWHHHLRHQPDDCPCHVPVASAVGKAMLVGTIFTSLVNIAYAQEPGTEPEAVTPENSAAIVKKEVSRLTSIWNERDRRIQSLRISGLRFAASCLKPQEAITRGEFVEMFFEDLKPAIESPDRSIDVLIDVTDDSFPRVRPDRGNGRTGRWEAFDYIEVAGGRRLETTDNGHVHVLIRRDGMEHAYDANIGQATLLPAQSNLMMESKGDFIFIPKIERIPNLRIEDDEGRSRLTNGYYSMEYEPRNGFVYKESMRLDDVGYIQERFQENAIVSGDGVIPGLSVSVRYWPSAGGGEAKVQRIRAYILDRIEVNSPIEDEDLVLQVPANTRVVDYGEEDRDPESSKTRPVVAITQTTEDAAEFAKRVSQISQPKRQLSIHQADKSAKWQTIMLITNVAVLLIIGAWIAIRRLRRVS